MPAPRLRSMTGYAEAVGRGEGIAVRVALRSVNHRFFDFHAHLPAGLEALEMRLREHVRQRIRRGRVDLYVSLEEKSPLTPRLNRELARAYLAAAEQLCRDVGWPLGGDVLTVLRLPGVVELVEAWPIEAVAPVLESVLAQVCEQHERMRAEEGAQLAAGLFAGLERIERALAELEHLARHIEPAWRQQLRERLLALVGETGWDSTRLLQEAALLAARADITEELLRLRSHQKQFCALLREGGEVGKPLDFLCQEMQREVNTLLAKLPGGLAEGQQMDQWALAIKREVEALREQVQNIE